VPQDDPGQLDTMLPPQAQKSRLLIRLHVQPAPGQPLGHVQVVFPADGCGAEFPEVMVLAAEADDRLAGGVLRGLGDIMGS
jgi:hypothetical protein